ncbi:TonB-dependent receptor plug domain-containing protein [Terricaulis sp.]|uniref:TonB-dependent receptor plug domain-containing protein n=1 Tax=Terricaulis sp. TaxID=2768686 RepID=UPI002AC422BC|nr:TonB-dependent receptor [Terricaulis sp.]MDZ4692780.1 TonB-dependent receptor [Terricaulis sp.]
MARSWKATRHIALSGTSLFAAVFLAAGPALAQSPGADNPADAAVEEDEIVVTGTSIRGVPPTGSNLISVTRADIETHGGANTPDLTASVPQLNSFNTAPQTERGGLGSFAPALRGLPASATLPLMNGHRLVGAAVQDTNPDFPLIPNLAIERIEVVADGASAIYGSDAVAGVVNFITRRHVDGLEVSSSYGVGDEYYAGHIGAIAGHDWGSGSILAAYQYTENDNILGGDRDYRVQDFRPYGGVDSRSTTCPAPNVLPDIYGYAAYGASPGFAFNTRNRCDSGAVTDLVPSSRVHALFLSARQDLTDNATLWAEILYSDRQDENQVAPPGQTVFLFNTNPFFQGPPGATNAFVEFRPDNLIGADHFTNTNEKQVGNSSFGLDLELPRDLNLTVYATLDWAHNATFVPQINGAALSAAAAGTTPSTALDPFGTGTAPNVVAAILDSASDVTEDQEVNLGAVRLDGPLLNMPGGPLRFALGGELRSESFEQGGFVGTTPVPEQLERNITSLYGELFIPIFGEGNEAPGFHSLALSLSGRYDHYSDFGSTTNPKLGIHWSPVEGLALRGSYGTSFRAPGLRQVGATVGSYYLSAAQAASFANDPTRGVAQVNTIYLLGGNENLQPEEAETYSLGIDFNPTSLPDLRASLTYYSIEYTDVIGTPSVPFVFTDPTFASLVYRNPTLTELNNLLSVAVPVTLPAPLPVIGNVLDLRLNNFGIRETDGLDFDINYRWDTDFGAVFADLAGNYILNYDTQFSPGTPVSNALDLGVSQWTARATLGVDLGSISLASFVNYRDGITNNFTTPTGVSRYEADPYMTVDLRVAWTLPENSWTEGTVLALQINDVFDEEPPFFPGTDGIAGAYNPIGRFIALNLRTSF